MSILVHKHTLFFGVENGVRKLDRRLTPCRSPIPPSGPPSRHRGSKSSLTAAACIFWSFLQVLKSGVSTTSRGKKNSSLLERTPLFSSKTHGIKRLRHQRLWEAAKTLLYSGSKQSCIIKTLLRFLPVNGTKSKPPAGQRHTPPMCCAGWKTIFSRISAQSLWALSRRQSCSLFCEK